jgi:hypothetical protein
MIDTDEMVKQLNQFNMNRHYAILHGEIMLKNLTGHAKRMYSPDNPRYEEYYSRLLPVFEGTYPCPVCFNKMTDKTMAFHRIDPEIYFGIMILHHPEYAGTAALISSDKAIQAFFYTFHTLLSTYRAYDKLNQEIEKSTNLKDYIQSKYKLSQEELIMNAIKVGEKVVKGMQESRQTDRWSALKICVQFNVVSDLYILSCKEAPHPLYGDELLKLRPRVKEYIDGEKRDDKTEALLRTIAKVRDLYYDQGIQEIVRPKGKKYTRKITSSTEEWLKGGWV